MAQPENLNFFFKSCTLQMRPLPPTHPRLRHLWWVFLVTGCIVTCVISVLSYGTLFANIDATRQLSVIQRKLAAAESDIVDLRREADAKDRQTGLLERLPESPRAAARAIFALDEISKNAASSMLVTYLMLRLAFPVHEYPDCLALLDWQQATVRAVGVDSSLLKLDTALALLHGLCSRQRFPFGEHAHGTAGNPVRAHWLSSSTDWHNLIPFSSNEEARAAVVSSGRVNKSSREFSVSAAAAKDNAVAELAQRNTQLARARRDADKLVLVDALAGFSTSAPARATIQAFWRRLWYEREILSSEGDFVPLALGREDAHVNGAASLPEMEHAHAASARITSIIYRRVTLRLGGRVNDGAAPAHTSSIFRARLPPMAAPQYLTAEDIVSRADSLGEFFAASSDTLHDSDLALLRATGNNWGPAATQFSCGKVADPCIAHASVRACVDDELCGWCSQLSHGRARKRKSTADGSGGACLSRLAGDFFREKAVGSRERMCAGALLVEKASVPAHYMEIRTAEIRAQTDSQDDPRSSVAKLRVYKLGSSVSASASSSSSSGIRGASKGLGSHSSPYLTAVHPLECSIIVTRSRPLILSVGGDSKMAYHFLTETAPAWLAMAAAGSVGRRGIVWSGTLPGLISNLTIATEASTIPFSANALATLRQHVWIAPTSTPEFVSWAQLFTGSCPRFLDAAAGTRGHGLPPAASGVSLCYASVSGVAEWVNTEGAREAVASAPTASEALTGLTDPVLVDISEGAEDYTAAAAVSLEPVLESVWGGARLGLRGLSVVAAAIADEARQAAAEVRSELGSIADNVTGPGPAAPQRLLLVLLEAVVTAADKRLASLVSSLPADVNAGGVTALSAYSTAIFGLWGVRPPRPTLTLLSRRNKRFITNEAEVAGAALTLGLRDRRLALAGGVDVILAPLESMPLYEQLLTFRRTTALAGAHGSGLINSVFMHSGSALIQLMPLATTGGDAFFAGPALAAGVSYLEYRQTAQSPLLSRQHWHYLDSSYAGRETSLLASTTGSHCCGQGVFFSFFIQQDMAVDIARFTSLLKTALLPLPPRKQKASNAHR